MKHMSTLALTQLLVEVVEELDERSAEAGHDFGPGAWFVTSPSPAACKLEFLWGGLKRGEDGWFFGWHAEPGTGEFAIPHIRESLALQDT